MATYTGRTYTDKANTTNCYYVCVKVHPFTTTDNEYAYNPSTNWVYVRSFTGLTEQEALDNTASAGGQWIRCDGEWRPVEAYSNGATQDNHALVFARVEVFWPGLPAKGVKYSRLPVLCGYGDWYVNYGSDNIWASPTVANEGVEVWMNGVHKDQCLTYGDAFSTYRKIQQDTSVPKFLTSGVTRNMEIMVSGSTTGYPFYNQFLTGSSTSINSCIFSAKTSGDKYKTIAEIGWKNYNNRLPGCTTDTFTWGNCGQEWTETECPEDSCPTDCEQVCDCDSQNTCYNENCQNCTAYSCETQLTNQCACFSADLTPECPSDLKIYDNCEYVQLQCLYANGSNTSTVVVPYLKNFCNELGDNMLRTTKLRLEGQFIRSASTRYVVAGFSTSLSRYYNSRNLLTTFGKATGGIIRGDLNITGRTGSYGFSGLTYDTDVDITCSDATIYNNITGELAFSGKTVTSNTEYAHTLFLYLYPFRYSRVRVYANENVILDMKPVMANCTKGNMTFDTKYGFFDSINGGFYPIIGDSVSAGIVSCVPNGFDEGGIYDTECLSGNGNDVYVNLANVVSSITVNNFRMRFEGYIPYSGSNQTLFATYSGSSTGTTYMRTRVMTYGNVNTNLTRWRVSYSGSTATANTADNTLSGQCYNKDIDVTIGNRWIYDNANSRYVYTAVTQNSASQFHSNLRVNFGKMRLKRLRIYDGSTLVRDFQAKVIVSNGIFKPCLSDAVMGSYFIIESSGVTYCSIPVSGITAGYLLKCMNGSSVHYQKVYNEGETIDKTLISDPTLEGRTFNRWNPVIPDTMPANNLTVYAVYTNNQYTIRYYVDGSLYTTQVYEYGATISEPTEPTPPDGYMFSGWNIPYTTMPAFDVNVYGTMEVYVPTYSINFYSGSTSWGSTPSCSKFKTLTYEAGATISYPSVATTCYPAAYGGWKLNCTSSGADAPSTMPAADTNVYIVTGYKVSTIYWRAKATGNTYTVYGTQSAEYMDSISGGPDLSEQAPDGYEWQGWGGLDSFSMPCNNKYVDGQFIEIGHVYYTISFFVDGTFYSSSQYEEGDTISYPTLTNPTGGYYGSWSPSPSTMPSQNVSSYTTSVMYDYTFATYVDDSMTNQTTYHYNDTVVIPNLPSNDGYSYSPWSISPSLLSGNKMPTSNVSASTTSTHIVYHLYYYKNGSVWVTEDHYYGDSLTAHALPSEQGKTYSAWNPSVPSTMPANNFSTYTTSAGTPYQIYYYVYNTSGSTSSTLYTTRTFTYQQSVSGLNEYPTIPTGQSWSGWTGEPSTMPANDVYVSGWTIPIAYTLQYYYEMASGNGTMLPMSSQTYNYTDYVVSLLPPIGGANYYYGTWVFDPALLTGSKMPASNVSAFTYVVETCTSQCSCDGDCSVVCSCDVQSCGNDCTSYLCRFEECELEGLCLKECVDSCSPESQTSYYFTYDLDTLWSDTDATNIKGLKWTIRIQVGSTVLDSDTHTYTSSAAFTSHSEIFSGTLSWTSNYEGMTATVYVTLSKKNGVTWQTEEYATYINPTSVVLNSLSWYFVSAQSVEN